MANRIFGEARLPLDDGRELTLRFDMNALIEAEEAADKNIDEVMAEIAKGRPRLKVARAMFYGSLRHHHPEISLDEAGDLLATDSEAVSEAMGRAMTEMAERRSKNPPNGAAAKMKPPLGTSTRSSKHGAKAA